MSLDFFEQLGVRVPASGRHRTALRLLEAANEAGRQAEPDADWRLRLEHAHRTAWETALIAVAAFRRRSPVRSTPFTLARLRNFMSGREVYDGGRSKAWDYQFELYVAAQLVLGGLDVVDGEPDLLFLYGHERVGVAAKRLGSLEPAQVRRNLASAASQIARTGRRGWIAINLDTRFAGIPIHQRRRDLLDTFGAAFDAVNPVAAEFTGESGVLGIMAYSYLSGWRTGGRRQAHPDLVAKAPFRWLCWEGADAGAQLFFKDFSEGWRGRVDGAVHAIMRGEVRLVI
jgi:hypothetical protein